MAQRKQAKVLTDAQIEQALDHLARSRYPLRDRAIFLLSVKAGLRACEIARITWRAVLASDGKIGDSIELVDGMSKGGYGGRTIPMAPALKSALAALHKAEQVAPDARIACSERSEGLTAGSVKLFFGRLYKALGTLGASSHSGRRTFITRAARNVVQAGGSLRDVQQLAGHANLNTTQRYIEGDSDAKRRLVAMI